MINERRKHVAITGCSRGLGRSLVDRFYEKGFTISGCARNSDQVAVLNSESQHQSFFTVVDVSDWQSVSQWADSVMEKHGAPDILINNAAVINQNANLWEVHNVEFSRLIDINIKGVFFVCKAFIPAMIKRSRGIILNLSSGWGRSTSPEVAPYCASKFAVEGMTLALSQELPAGLAAIPVNPGIINTEMLQKCFASGARNYPGPDEWSRMVIDDILYLGPEHNGISLTLPLEHEWEE